MMEFFGVPFEVIPSELSEFFAEGEGQWRALDMARKKAFMLSRKVKGRYILAADTMVQVGKHYLGKPKDRDDAVRMLTALSGREHIVYTGVAVLRGGELRQAAARTAVRFRPLTSGEIERYIATGEPMDKAGAYGIQGRGALFVEFGLRVVELLLAIGQLRLAILDLFEAILHLLFVRGQCGGLRLQ